LTKAYTMENQIQDLDNVQEKSYNWIANAINSSNNPFHIECCKKLIELYVAKFPDALKEAELLMLLYDKGNQVNYI
jgi:hypothetical protein